MAEERGIYLGKMMINPDVVTMGVNRDLDRKRKDVMESEKYLTRNLTKYGIDRSLLVPKAECDGCSIRRDRVYSHFGLITSTDTSVDPTNGSNMKIVTLGSECAKRMLTRHCNVCDTKYDFDNGKSTYLHCANCRNMKFDYGFLSGKTYGHIKRKLTSEDKIWYNTFCESIIHGNPDSKFRLYLINENIVYTQDNVQDAPEPYPVKYYTSGYFTNCNVYYINKLLNPNGAHDVESIDQQIGDHCEYCNVDYLYDIGSQKVGKTCVYYYNKWCVKCREDVEQSKSKIISYGFHKGRTFSSILHAHPCYVLAYGTLGYTRDSDDCEFTVFAKKAIATKVINLDTTIDRHIDTIANRCCKVCNLPFEPLAKSDAYCADTDACKLRRMLDLGDTRIVAGKLIRDYRYKNVKDYVHRCKGVSAKGNDSYVRKYIKWLVENGYHMDSSYYDLVMYHDVVCVGCSNCKVPIP